MELTLFRSNRRTLSNHILLFLLVFSMFFPINHAFPAYGGSDFTSFWLYLSDFLIVGLIFLNFKVLIQELSKHPIIIIIAAWTIVNVLVHASPLVPLNLYSFARLFLLFALYLAILGQSDIREKALISLFVVLAAVQSALALGQFLHQASFGLYRLGESHLAPNMFGVAKLVSHGTVFIRGYGTFPHPNLLAAFLMTAILFGFYLIHTSRSRKVTILWTALLVLNIFGLIAAFSRAGFGVAIVAICIFFIGLTILAGWNRRTGWLLGITIISLLAGVLCFRQFIQTRATLTDAAVTERVVYDKIGLNIIKKYPWQGIGLGTSILHMQQFSPVHLESWQIQPVHNYYLLAAAELGIIGALLFLILFGWHWLKLLLTIKNSYQLALSSIFTAFLILMLFDHYFYTLEQTRLLLWFILALSAREISKNKELVQLNN